MAKLAFTAHLRRLVPESEYRYDGGTIGEVLRAAFADHAQLEHYIVDEQGRLRQHVAIFLDGSRLPAGTALTASVGPDSEIYVMQALSGG